MALTEEMLSGLAREIAGAARTPWGDEPRSTGRRPSGA